MAKRGGKSQRGKGTRKQRAGGVRARKKSGAPRQPDARTEPIPIPDRRVLEGAMYRTLGGMYEPDADLAAAQELVYQAFDKDDFDARVDMAKEAIRISPDCADAYVLLAEHSDDLGEQISLYERAVAAGERSLRGGLRQYEGHFWLALETRPYMRARLGLALALWREGRREEAVEHLQTLLRLNPGDNQGARWVLVNYLAELGRDRDMETLLDAYSDEIVAAWAYSRALLQFRREGDTPAARQQFERAAERNRFVLPYLAGSVQIPPYLPDSFSLGSEEEGVLYAADALPAWRATPGAIAWVRSIVAEPESAKPSREREHEIGQLPQDPQEVWVVDVRRAPEGAAPKDADREWLMFVVDARDGTPISLEFLESDADAEGLFSLLLDVMEHSAGGPSRRPSEIALLDRGRVNKLRTRLKRIGVRCALAEHAEEIRQALSGMLERVTVAKSDPRPLSEIPQRPEVVWQADIRLLNTWMHNEGRPVRPWVILVTNRTDGLVYAPKLVTDPPAAGSFWEVLEDAMRDSRYGEPHRPGTIQVRSHDWRAALQSRLHSLNISVDVEPELDHLEEVFEGLAETLEHGPGFPGLVETGDVHPDQAGPFFEAAAEFYRKAPWRKIAPDAVIEIATEDRNLAVWYGVVMGQSGMVNGLALYDDPESLREILTGRGSDADNAMRTSGLTVMFGEETEMAFSDLDAIEQYGWPIAAPEAYPGTMRLQPGEEPRPANAQELRFLEACLRGVPEFIARRERSCRMTLATGAGEMTLTFSRK